MAHNRETNYDRQVRLVEAALAALGAAQPHTAAQIRGWIEANHAEELEPLRASWSAYLSNSAADGSNRIERTPGKYTYFLRAEMPALVPAPGAELEAAPAEAELDVAPARQQREALLYPTLATWLRSRGYAARVTATTKKGGSWGNPDVTGLNIVDGFLGQKAIELATVEAKISPSGWRYFFFEAVAHKRFAHRAYFAFACGSDEPSLSDIESADEMRSYGEKYRVGVLVVFLPTAMYSRLLGGDVAGLSLPLEELRIEELWPAIYEDVTASAKTDFLWNVLGLKDDRDLYVFDE